MKLMPTTLLTITLLALTQGHALAADIGPAPAASRVITWCVVGVLVVGVLLASFLPTRRN